VTAPGDGPVRWLGDVDPMARQVVVLLAKVTEMTAMATDVFLSGDLPGVGRVGAANEEVQTLVAMLEREVEDRLRNNTDPDAVPAHLSVLRIAHEIELTGGLAENIAKAARRAHPRSLDPRIRGRLARLGDQAVAQLRAAADAFADADEDTALAVGGMNEVMGELIRDLIRTSIEATADQVEDPQSAIQVALMARYFERVGDHALVIARRVTRPRT
jgi:phosphate transport system protein